MANKTTNGKLRTGLLRFIIALLLICIAGFTFAACGTTDSSSTDSDTTYDKVETDDGTIKNASFEFGTANTALTEFPKTAPLNWAINADNSASSSTVNSGIVNTTADAWKTLLNTLYDDDDFKNYAIKKFNVDLEGIKNANDNDDEKVKKHIVEEILLDKMPSPTAKDGNKVLMLNNYSQNSKYGLGTAQKATNSTSIVIDKGTHAKISVWVKTQNIVGSGEKAGANVRVNTIINTQTVNTFAMYGIKDTEWTEYTFYVSADNNYDTTVSLILGLGFGSSKSADFANDYTEGTAYFDHITYETISTTDMAAVADKDEYLTDLNNDGMVSFNAKNYSNTAATKRNAVLKMDINNSLFINSANKKDLDLSNNGAVNYKFFEANATIGGNKLTSKDIIADSSIGTLTATTNRLEIKNIKNASAELTFKFDDFEIGSEEYAYLTFGVVNDLGRLDKNGVNIYVYDVYGVEQNVTKISSVPYDDAKVAQYNILIKNNFPEYGDVSYPDRAFYIKIVIGATDLSGDMTAADLSSGSVTISNMRVSFGKTYQYERDFDAVTQSYVYTQTTTQNYGYYNFVSTSNTDTVVALYAGNVSDFAAPEHEHAIESAPSDVGTILSAPSVVSHYEGITNDHAYVTESTNTVINDRTGNIAGKNHAGAISTKYLDAYAALDGLSNIKTALNHTDSEDKQMIMIYNDVNAPSSYGFVGESTVIEADAFASITVNLRVVGSAKANVYLVDVSSDDKSVMDISFTSNHDGAVDIANGATYNKKLAFENITADMMDKSGANKGWLTLTFYVATGKNMKNFRIEVWNGSRDKNDANGNSGGYVFFDNIHPETASAFVESTESNPINDSESVLAKSGFEYSDLVFYKRVLDATEVKFNNEQTDASKKVSYDAKCIWAKNQDTVYAVFNTLPSEVTAVDPYETSTETEGNKEGCAAETDPSTFWLSFSSILLVVVLVAALAMLVIKNVLRKRKKGKKVQSGYNVNSRYSAKKKEEKAKKVEKESSYDEYEDEKIDEPETADALEEITEETTEEINPEEVTLDEFVYGDVQDFGELEDNSDKPEEEIETPSQTDETQE